MPNGHPREEKRACRSSRQTSRRTSARAAAGRLPRAPDTLISRENPRAEVGENVRVGVGPVEFSFNCISTVDLDI